QNRNNTNLNAEQISQLYNQSTHQVTKALETLGYYNSKVTETINHQNNQFIIKYKVELGQPVIINNIEFNITGPKYNSEYKIDPIFNKITQNYNANIYKGQQLNHDIYEEQKNNILGDTIRNGYLKAEFTVHQIMVNIEDN